MNYYMKDINEIFEEYKRITRKECYAASVVPGEAEIMDDKMGGKPYLPVGAEYPKDKNGEYIALLLQIDLEKVDFTNHSGILEMFIDKGLNYPREYHNDNMSAALFKFDSNFKDVDLNIGDAGIIFGYISEEDLKNGNFDKSIVDWDCC